MNTEAKKILIEVCVNGFYKNAAHIHCPVSCWGNTLARVKLSNMMKKYAELGGRKIEIS